MTLPTPDNRYNFELQTQLCKDFNHTISEGDITTTTSLEYIVPDVEQLSGVPLHKEVIYAHLLFAGSPLVSFPFLNSANSANPSLPLSHKNAAYITAQNMNFAIDNGYWSLYLLRPQSGPDIYAVTWLEAATSAQIVAVKNMLRLLPNLHLFSVQTHSQEVSYTQFQPTATTNW